MVVHLTIADLFVCFVVMPLEIGWRLSVQWFAGNAACKVLMFIRAFAFYLSSATLVVLSIDRYIAIAQPMATLKVSNKCTYHQYLLLSSNAVLYGKRDNLFACAYMLNNVTQDDLIR